MNRETWFRLLQVAVVAPFIYTISEKQTGYFRLGLKFVAGSIVIMNIEPLMKDLTPLFQAAVEMKARADRLTAEEKDSAIEGEFAPAPTSA
jgi:hypothetical protein